MSLSRRTGNRQCCINNSANLETVFINLCQRQRGHGVQMTYSSSNDEPVIRAWPLQHSNSYIKPRTDNHNHQSRHSNAYSYNGLVVRPVVDDRRRVDHPLSHPVDLVVKESENLLK